MTTREQKLRYLVEKLLLLAEAHSAKSADKDWSEWVRDREHGQEQGIRYADDELASILKEEVEVSDAMVDASVRAFWPVYFESIRVNGAGKPAHRTGMKAAITAALKEAGK